MASPKDEARSPIRVALDASVLMEIYAQKVDLDEEIKKWTGPVEWVIPKPVEQELAFLEERRSRERKAIRVARKWMKNAHVKVVETRAQEGDLALIELAEKGHWVVTQDRKLKQSLKKTNARILFLRQGKGLEMA
ncbi:MAG: PIN domain-containing protein [Candidatus Diapherotrites archaeon]|nr:PIN domain-containing protein [Candidatus Diapherotrites archaeon]